MLRIEPHGTLSAAQAGALSQAPAAAAPAFEAALTSLAADGPLAVFPLENGRQVLLWSEKKDRAAIAGVDEEHPREGTKQEILSHLKDALNVASLIDSLAATFDGKKQLPTFGSVDSRDNTPISTHREFTLSLDIAEKTQVEGLNLLRAWDRGHFTHGTRARFTEDGRGLIVESDDFGVTRLIGVDSGHVLTAASPPNKRRTPTKPAPALSAVIDRLGATTPKNILPEAPRISLEAKTDPRSVSLSWPGGSSQVIARKTARNFSILATSKNGDRAVLYENTSGKRPARLHVLVNDGKHFKIDLSVEELTGEKRPIYAAFSARENRVSLVLPSGELAVWDFALGSLERRGIPLEWPFIAAWAAVSPDGRRLAYFHPQNSYWGVLDITQLWHALLGDDAPHVWHRMSSTTAYPPRPIRRHRR